MAQLNRGIEATISADRLAQMRRVGVVKMALIDAERNDKAVLDAEDAAIRLAEAGGPDLPEGEFRLELDDDARTEAGREDKG